MRTKIELKPGRNSPCPCGSGKKFKRCCFTLENFLAAVRTGKLFPGDPLPADLPLETLIGTVVYNDGNEAKVRVFDDTAVFYRGPETNEEWNAEYAIGKQMVIERFNWADLDTATEVIQ